MTSKRLWSDTITQGRLEWVGLVLLALLALALRLWALDEVPPGWRDDELSNALVLSQHVRDGDLRLFYPDASGHEFLYHAVAAGFLTLFGTNLWGIRLLSVLLGVGGVLLTYLLARQLFGRAVGWVAALGVSTSFWGLMYSRIGMRHISAVLMALAAFYFLWRALNERSRWLYVLSGLALGVGFYTYFASRLAPAIVLGLALYLALVDRPRWHRHWRGLALTLMLAGALFVPLWWATQNTPGAEARVDEVAKPLHAARQGDWSELARHTRATLGMFHADGDDEWLYNIPHRPVFGPLGAALFLVGLLLALARAMPRRLRGNADPRYAFGLIWLLAALAPGALSTPPASLGHTILALPVAYLFPALALAQGYRWLRRRPSPPFFPFVLLGALLLAYLGAESYRGLFDYFRVWPRDGYVRFLHHADHRDIARYVSQHDPGGPPNLAVGGILVEPWQQEALEVDLTGVWQVRWFDPNRALPNPAGGGWLALTDYPPVDSNLAPLYPPVRLQTESFALYPAPAIALPPAVTRFQNGLALHAFSPYRLQGAELVFSTTWSVERPLDLPPNPLVSKPPPPDVAVGPRLAIFVHLLDSQGHYVTGQDGLGLDPYTLQPGDRFVHIHRLSYPPAGAGLSKDYTVHLGLYDPLDGQRWLTQTGQDHLFLFAPTGP